MSVRLSAIKVNRVFYNSNGDACWLDSSGWISIPGGGSVTINAKDIMNNYYETKLDAITAEHDKTKNMLDLEELELSMTQKPPET